MGMTQNCILRITVNKPNIFFPRQDYQYLEIDLKLQTINLITFCKNQGRKKHTHTQSTHEMKTPMNAASKSNRFLSFEPNDSAFLHVKKRDTNKNNKQ